MPPPSIMPLQATSVRSSWMLVLSTCRNCNTHLDASSPCRFACLACCLNWPRPKQQFLPCILNGLPAHVRNEISIARTSNKGERPPSFRGLQAIWKTGEEDCQGPCKIVSVLLKSHKFIDRITSLPALIHLISSQPYQSTHWKFERGTNSSHQLPIAY